MSGSAAAVTLAGMYISLQNLLAPIAGGAILLDLLSNLFPWLRYHLQGGRRKYVFSELNEPAVCWRKIWFVRSRACGWSAKRQRRAVWR